jgi:drug/metabolite transporter (DMT)-like permease
MAYLFIFRVFFATLFILPFYIRVKSKDMNLKGICLSLLGGMFFAFELVFWNTAVIVSNTTFPTLIVNLSSVWVGIGAMILFREKLNRFHWAGNMIAIIGVAIIIGINNIIRMKIDTSFVFSIIASIFLALYALSVKEVRKIYSTIQVVFFHFLRVYHCIVNLLHYHGKRIILFLTANLGLFIMPGPDHSGWGILFYQLCPRLY